MVSNATGWNELFNGNLPKASFVMYDTALGNWTLAILFVAFQLIVFMKTRNPLVAWVVGIIFASLYFAGGSLLGQTVFKNLAMQVMFIILVIELGGIMFGWFANR